MPRTKLERFGTPRIILYWVLGALSAVFGGLIAGNTKIELGTTQDEFVISLLISGLMVNFGQPIL